MKDKEKGAGMLKKARFERNPEYKVMCDWEVLSFWYQKYVLIVILFSWIKVLHELFDAFVC